jgi:hypothetical protein
MKAATVVAARNFTGGASQCPDPTPQKCAAEIVYRDMLGKKFCAPYSARTLFCAPGWKKKQA